MDLKDLPSPETTPELWIDPFTLESIQLVAEACDRWLKRRETLRRRRNERLAAIPPAAGAGSDGDHSALN